ncbi:MAG: hypothetical protein V2I24_03035, partial [Halieaceae bacterium]|nr:hypothetical protein [Halieaceae bacterium]
MSHASRAPGAQRGPRRRQDWHRRIGMCLAAAALAAVGIHAQAADKPNILVIWGDDVGQSNISAYSHGLMGYQ